MKQFLSILLRNQFNLFYRFGYTFIPNSELVEFDGTITDETKDQMIKKFETTTPFEYDEEYLILHIEKDISNDDAFVQFEIPDIVAVYPLSGQAKSSIESKIDQRIRLEKPIFESVLPIIETRIENKGVEKAISALWNICKIEEPLDKYISEIGIEKILKGLEHRKFGTKPFKIQGGNYWEYLIAYDRFDFFPNYTLGYFYDAGQIFAYSKGLPSFEGSGTHKFLEKLNSSNPTVKLPEIIKYFETEEQLKRYVSQTTTRDIKQYIVAPLYLMLRDEIRKSDDISQAKLFKNIDYWKTFGDSFNYVLILLGAFFGFRKYYDYYYTVLNLRFYKTYNLQQAIMSKEEQKEQITIHEIDAEKPANVEFKKNSKGPTPINEPERIQEEAIKKEIAVSKSQVEEPIKSHGSPNKTIETETNKSGNSSQYIRIIEHAFKDRNEIVLTDIVALVKEKTKQKVTNTIIKNVIRQIEELEIVPKKKPEMARRKERAGTLFNQ